MRPSHRDTLVALSLTLLLAAGCMPRGATPQAATPVAAEPAAVVYVVRHAERADASRDPALSAAGRARAEALAETLRDAGIGGIVTTQFTRTRETAAPLAAAAGVTPVVVEVAGGLPEHVAAVARAVREQARHGAVLVVGHSNTVPAIVRALGGPAMPDLCETAFSHLFVVVLEPAMPARLARARFGAPDPEGADACPGMQVR